MAKGSRKQFGGWADGHEEVPIRIMPWWWAPIATTVSIALGVGAWFIVWLIAKHNATLKIEAIKVGLSVTAGVGAACALLLAFRRQLHSEYVARDTTFDAAQRRITELYAKAVEQIGHDRPAVRLGGLYALERLGQIDINHRQTVIDVICAYLRMPYDPPAKDHSSSEPQSQSYQPPVSANIRSQDGPQQELLVRMAAQNLLIRHLEDPELYPASPYWDGVTIDLRGAHLIDIAFSGCRFNAVDFSAAIFNGSTWFDEATFTDLRCDFDGARFNGDVTFLAYFEGGASFEGAHFNEDVSFHDSTLNNDGIFKNAKFHSDANFQGVEFKGGVTDFRQAYFKKVANFKGTYFKAATFVDAEFSGPEPDFTGATARFREVNSSIWPDSWLAIPAGDGEGKLRLVPAIDEESQNARRSVKSVLSADQNDQAH